jgi:hypothetical protein
VVVCVAERQEGVIGIGDAALLLIGERCIVIVTGLLLMIAIAGVLIAFLIATLAAAGLVTYLIGSLSFAALLAAWAIIIILVTIVARVLGAILNNQAS